MKQNWEKLYADMLSDLHRCQELQLPEAEIAECCCRIAMNYWLKVKEMFKDSVNYDEEEEINFFKYVKPRFTSHIEYNLVISQAILFLPTDTEAVVTYWEEETKKYQRFFDKHQEFINYYDSNNTENDSRYFLPRNNRLLILSWPKKLSASFPLKPFPSKDFKFIHRFYLFSPFQPVSTNQPPYTMAIWSLI